MKTKHFYETFHPEHYDLFIEVNRKNKLITGKTTVTGVAQTATVFLHQKFMTIKSVTSNDEEVPFKVNDQEEKISIELPQSGQVSLQVEYSAPLTDTMMGIYPSYYRVDGVKKEIIGTQFETTAARQAFPCVDEPEAKATFSLALKYDEHAGETTIANMPEIKVVDGVHYFEKTVRMSSYLVAFGFGELQSKTTSTKDGVKVGVFATKAHQAKDLDFALGIAKRAIEFYEDFYQTKYPLPHSWHLALPDFSAGAMENWGLITYREQAVLIDPDNSTMMQKAYVASVIAHELAHQWFGDLVTMKWWDDLWLNESFANMMMYLSLDALEPSWHVWNNMFQTSEAPSALERDAIDGVQAIHVNVEDPAEIDSLFDGAIVYAKGARVLVMVRNLLGDDALRSGLKYYFDQHQYGNATGDDLWQALSTATDLDIGKIMHTWIKQPGYPVVRAKVDQKGHLILTQQQFFMGKGHDVGRIWQIPLNANFTSPQIMADKELDLGSYQDLRTKAGHALRLNVGNTSHFIVEYDDTLLADIMAEVTELKAVDQLQILQDLNLLARGKYISYAEVVPLLAKFANINSNIVTTMLYNIVFSLKKFVTPNSEGEKNLKAFVNNLSKSQVARLGFQENANEDDEDKLMRPTVISASLYAENSQTQQALHNLFVKHQNDLSKLSADIRSYVLVNEVRNFARAGLVEKLIIDYQESVDPYYKRDLNDAITSTKNEKEIQKIIAAFENADIVKPQDLRLWYVNTLSEPAGQQAAWDWLRNRWDWLEKTVGGDMEFLTFITVTSGEFHTEKRLQEFKDFFIPKLNDPGLTREIKMDITSITGVTDLVKLEKDAVQKAIAASL